MKEIVFEVIQEEDGGYVAEALGESIFTQADKNVSREDILSSL